MGPLIPLFGTSGEVTFGFQSQSGKSYLHKFGGGIRVTCSLQFTSGTTPADLLVFFSFWMREEFKLGDDDNRTEESLRNHFFEQYLNICVMSHTKDGS